MSEEPIVGAVLGAFLAGVAGILALHLCDSPRCARCDRSAVADDAEQAAPGLPVVMIDYRCPGCHRIVDRRCLGTWD